jgi:hypothetical protein
MIYFKAQTFVFTQVMHKIAVNEFEFIKYG